MHRSHFGSRYTLGCCGYAGLLWGAQFPELAHPCPQGHKDIYAYQVTTVNLGLGWQLLLDHVQTTKADIYHVHSVVLDFGQYSRTAIPVSKHTCCTIFGIFILFLGCLPCFFYNQDLWSWIVAILQESMPSVITHLLHKFKIHVHCPGPETGPAPFMWCASVVDT